MNRMRIKKNERNQGLESEKIQKAVTFIPWNKAMHIYLNTKILAIGKLYFISLDLMDDNVIGHIRIVVLLYSVLITFITIYSASFYSYCYLHSLAVFGLKEK